MKILKSIVMDAAGRVTIPAEVRRELQLSGETELLVGVDDHALVLQPAVTIPKEDAWAYTAEHKERLRRALDEAEHGEIIRGREVRLTAEA